MKLAQGMRICSAHQRLPRKTELPDGICRLLKGGVFDLEVDSAVRTSNTNSTSWVDHPFSAGSIFLSGEMDQHAYWRTPEDVMRAVMVDADSVLGGM